MANGLLFGKRWLLFFEISLLYRTVRCVYLGVKLKKNCFSAKSAALWRSECWGWIKLALPLKDYVKLIFPFGVKISISWPMAYCLENVDCYCIFLRSLLYRTAMYIWAENFWSFTPFVFRPFVFLPNQQHYEEGNVGWTKLALLLKT